MNMQMLVKLVFTGGHADIFDTHFCHVGGNHYTTAGGTYYCLNGTSNSVQIQTPRVNHQPNSDHTLLC